MTSCERIVPARSVHYFNPLMKAVEAGCLHLCHNCTWPLDEANVCSYGQTKSGKLRLCSYEKIIIPDE